MLDFSVTFIITIINIAVLFFILKKILWKPVTKFMADRTKRVEESLEQSEKAKNEARQLLADYKAKLNTAESEASNIIRTARGNAEEEARVILAESRAKAEAELERSRKQIEMEHQADAAKFRKEAAALVVAATGRLLQREIKSEDSQGFVNTLLEELSFPAEPGSAAERSSAKDSC
jgi:F-type H+-transporting ATPase subunit b